MPTLPDDEDLQGVVDALLRLQDTYKLSSRQIADGIFTPVNRSPPLTGLPDYLFLSDYRVLSILRQESLLLFLAEMLQCRKPASPNLICVSLAFFLVPFLLTQ